MNGTYVAVKPGHELARLIGVWMERAKLENRVAVDDLHVTVLYSRTVIDPECKPDSWYVASPKNWGFLNSDGDRALVLFLDSPELTRRHQELMAKGGTHDFAEYTPHLTVSYNAGHIDLKKLPPLGLILLLGKEYSEELRE